MNPDFSNKGVDSLSNDRTLGADKRKKPLTTSTSLPEVGSGVGRNPVGCRSLTNNIRRRFYRWFLETDDHKCTNTVRERHSKDWSLSEDCLSYAVFTTLQ